MLWDDVHIINIIPPIHNWQMQKIKVGLCLKEIDMWGNVVLLGTVNLK